MTTLSEWLEAQIAEDERIALATPHETDSSEAYSCPAIRTEPLGDLKYGEEACWCGRAARVERMLAECNAKRRIIEAHSGEHYCPIPVVTGEHGQLWTEREGPCWTLRLLSEPYANRPRYEEARRIPDDDE